VADVPRAITRYTPLSELPEFLSPHEARAFLDVSRAAIYDALRTGSLPSIRVGRLIRIPKSALTPAERSA
jgi:excisionase family DNA binding protein